MDIRMLAVIIAAILVAFALTMFIRERRAVAKRKADGTYVDVSDVIAFGSEAVTGKDPSPPKRR